MLKFPLTNYTIKGDEMKTLVIILALMTLVIAGCDENSVSGSDSGTDDCFGELPYCFNTVNTSGIMECEDGQWYIAEDCQEQGLCCIFVEIHGPQCWPCP